MRIVCLSDAEINRNGVGTYYSDLMDHLKDAIDYAELICPGPNGNNGALKLTTALPGDPTQRLHFPNFHALLCRIQKIEPDIMILPTPGPFGLMGYGFSKYFKSYLCVGYHTAYEKLTDLYWKSWLSDISRIYMKFFNRLLFSSSDVVITNSNKMTVNAKAAGAHKVEMIGTPIAKSFLKDPAAPLSPEVRSVCYCGRLTLEKNIPEILQAAEQMPDRRFTIAGDGPLRADVEKAAGRLRNLSYAGWVSRDEVKTVIDLSDLVILPSKIESFGTIALEAMARRRLVLVSANCGILNWRNLNKGVYVIGKEESLFNAIDRICRIDFSERLKKAETAYQAAQAFNDFTIKQWTNLFSAISN